MIPHRLKQQVSQLQLLLQHPPPEHYLYMYKYSYSYVLHVLSMGLIADNKSEVTESGSASARRPCPADSQTHWDTQSVNTFSLKINSRQRLNVLITVKLITLEKDVPLNGILLSGITGTSRDGCIIEIKLHAAVGPVDTLHCAFSQIDDT